MKNTRTNKNHNNNKITKVTVFIELLALTLGIIALICLYLHPSHYKGDTFTNAKTSVSSTTSSTSSSSSNTPESTHDSDTNNNTVHSESTNTEQVTEQYSTLWVYASAQKGYCDSYGNNINRSGFYILTPVQNHTNYVEVIEIDMRTNDEYHVKVYGETDEINDINYQSACANAEAFCNWLREQAPDGHTTYGLNSNYDYWVKNCKYKNE